MLSETLLRQIGNVDREPTERRVRRIFESWAAGDVDDVVSYLAPDVVFPSNGFWSGAQAPISGREQVAAHIREMAAKVDNIASVLHEITIDGDRVAVHRTAVGRRRDNGRRYQCDFINFFRFRDGLVVEFTSYGDAAWQAVVAD